MLYFSYSHFDEAFQSFKRIRLDLLKPRILASVAQLKRDGLYGSALIIYFVSAFVRREDRGERSGL